MSSHWSNVCYETTECGAQSGLADDSSRPPTWSIIIDGSAVCLVCLIYMYSSYLRPLVGLVCQYDISESLGCSIVDYIMLSEHSVLQLSLTLSIQYGL